MLCLDAVAKGESVWPGRAYQRFKDATNMTNRLGALSALVCSHARIPSRPCIVPRDVPKRALVIDTWFMLQAGAPEVDGQVFARVKQLLKHSDFSMRKSEPGTQPYCPGSARTTLARPPRRRCRLCVLGRARDRARRHQPAIRRAASHARSTAGALAEPYRSAAREAIARVAAKPDLSGGVREIVSNALAI